MSDETGAWQPRAFKRLIRQLGTSTAVAHIDTYDGEGYAKTLGNPQGPQALVCELVGTRLAQWLGLPVFEIALIPFPPEPQLDLGRGCHSLPGPAFCTRAEPGRSWDGSAEDLQELDNPEALAGLVVFDTWTRNCDRHVVRGGATSRNLGNVFFSERDARGGKYRLRVMDHTACFRCHGTLDRSKLGIDAVRDPTVYGLFPEFVSHVTELRVRAVLERLRSFGHSDARVATSEVPPAWELSVDLRDRLEEFCVERARFVCETLEAQLRNLCGWQPCLPL